ncbi:MAG: phospho-N-acetylmuramoyl-pentapeptide-transferase [Puniceicoccales bacterium]|nr:phospho-N-acetylmuramoyl-pentapeptide-transferase [Puniceicoccales bacterium]
MFQAYVWQDCCRECVAARCIVGFLLSVVVGFFVSSKIFRFLGKKNLNQVERGREVVRDLADLHKRKNGTTTMGGFAIFVSAIISILLLAKLNAYVILALFVCISLGALGLVDDFLKFSKKNTAGISGKKKLALQLAVTAVVFVTLHSFNEKNFATMLPFFDWCPRWLFAFSAFAFAFFVISGTSNAVNLTDGLDGLASICVIPNLVFFSMIAYISGSEKLSLTYGFSYISGIGELAVMLSCFCGALLTFLWYNAQPATVIMGDTGSLMLGGLLAVSALALRVPFCLLLTGSVFVIEVLSDIIQVGSKKLRGKRMFLMAPIHHHFELSGVSETKIVYRAGIITWISTVLCAVILLYV